MERSRFDALTKSLAMPTASRRSALRAGASTLIAALGIARSADAATCRPISSICRKDGDCCGGTCGAPDQYGRRRCGCSSNAECGSNVDCCYGVCCSSNMYCDTQLQSCQFSCFVAGTRVAMADGTSRPIELVAFGDLVLGANGSVSRVIGVETPRLGDRKLYSLNGGDPFVTAEHPFMTAEGWKSIDPKATADEQPALSVGHLQPGDSLVELADLLVPAMIGGMEPVEVRTRSVALRSITPTTGDPGTVLYNLLLDGDHTYFANDLLVHNKA